MSNGNGTQLDEKQTALLDEFRSLMFDNSEAPLTQREKQVSQIVFLLETFFFLARQKRSIAFCRLHYGLGFDFGQW